MLEIIITAVSFHLLSHKWNFIILIPSSNILKSEQRSTATVASNEPGVLARVFNGNAICLIPFEYSDEVVTEPFYSHPEK